MKLYHGTTATIALKAFESGLMPRRSSGSRGNWPNCPSSPDLVYMTETYAGYFASCATSAAGDVARWGIVEIDTDMLDEFSMMPDEDFLEQATRGQVVEGLRTRTMVGRTRWFRNNISRFSAAWTASVRHLGNASYMGIVPPEAITRVSIFDPSSNRYVSWWCSDPIINLMNHRLMGAAYRGLTKWFFEPPTDEEINAIAGNTIGACPDPVIGTENIAAAPGASAELVRHSNDMVAKAREALSNRSGLEVLRRHES